jgi:hypothetical protein
LKDGDSVILEHMKKCGLSGIIETKEEKLCPKLDEKALAFTL